jgi:hypothetical protein
MTALSFEILSSRAEPHAAVPTIMLRLRVSAGEAVEVHALALRCQIRIEPQRRRYDAAEEDRLYELFGEPSRWGESLRPFLWTHVSTMVTGFTGSTEVDLPLECTYDFEVAAARYLHALADGAVPLLVLFSGTVFTGARSGFTAEPVSWAGEASYHMPVAVWRGVMDSYFPGGSWIRVSRLTLDELQQYRSTHAFLSWDLTFEQLLKEAGAGVHERSETMYGGER